MIVKYTNSNAVEIILSDAAGNVEGTLAWTPTSSEEIMAFLGIVILMGIVKLPSTQLYWSRDERLHQRGVTKIFPRDRFNLLLKYFYCNDPEQLQHKDDPEYKLYRVKPILEQLSQNFLDLYDPHRAQSIDETMVKFKGRLKFLQYMPLKPVKRGIKIWCRCDSSNGYLCQMDVYVGKDETQPPARGRRRRRHVENQQQPPADRQEEGLVTRVVRLLTRKLVGKNYFVVMDNFFSSVELFKTLLEEKIFCCGTLRENRKHFPRSLKGQVLKNQGDSKFAGDGNLVCTIWKDKARKKHVTVLSSQCNPVGDLENDVVKRRVKSTEGEGFEEKYIYRPPPIAFYNKYMGGVDLHDQNRRYYNLTLKAVKWWRYLFWFLLDVSIINSFILYKETVDKPASHLQFRLQLSEELIGRFCARKKAGRPCSSQPVGPSNVLEHAYDRVVEGRAGCCENCRKRRREAPKGSALKKKRVSETRFGCRGCRVVLCKGQCFEEWHKNLERNTQENIVETPKND